MVASVVLIVVGREKLAVSQLSPPVLLTGKCGILRVSKAKAIARFNLEDMTGSASGIGDSSVDPDPVAPSSSIQAEANTGIQSG